jgi:hypothetical protein
MAADRTARRVTREQLHFPMIPFPFLIW